MEFEKTGSVAKKQKHRRCTKRTVDAQEEVKNMLSEETLISVRKSCQSLSVSTFTLWKMLRFDVKAKFCRAKSVQPLSDAHKEQRK